MGQIQVPGERRRFKTWSEKGTAYLPKSGLSMCILYYVMYFVMRTLSRTFAKITRDVLSAVALALTGGQLFREIAQLWGIFLYIWRLQLWGIIVYTWKLQLWGIIVYTMWRTAPVRNYCVQHVKDCNCEELLCAICEELFTTLEAISTLWWIVDSWINAWESEHEAYR